MRSFKLSQSKGEDSFSQPKAAGTSKSQSQVATGNDLKMSTSPKWDITTLVEKEFFTSTENAAVSSQNISDDTTEFFVSTQKESKCENAAISNFDDDDDAFPSTQDMDGVFTSTQNPDLDQENFESIVPNLGNSFPHILKSPIQAVYM